MERGYIKSYRKILDNPIFKNPELFQLAYYCLHKANHLDRWVSVQTGRGTTQIKVKKGQFIYGRKKTAQETGQKLGSIHKRLEKLKKYEFLTIQANTHFSVITICNWELYQSEKEGSDQATEHPRNNQGTTKEQPRNTNKNDKNYKNEKNKEKEDANASKKSSRFFPPSIPDVREYCNSRKNNIDPETFVDFYSSKNWMVGKTKMKDWKAAVRTWEKRNNYGGKKADDDYVPFDQRIMPENAGF